MQAERHELIKVVFPQIRKLSESRRVTFTEIDLRWGANLFGVETDAPLVNAIPAL